MALTKTQLRDRVFKELNIVPAGQSASAEDANLMTSAIDEVFAQYENEFPFLSSSTPDWAVGSVVKIIAARASPKFGNAPVSMSERDALGLFAAERSFRIPSQQLKHTFY